MENLIIFLVYFIIVLSYLYLLWIGLLNYSYRNKPIPEEVSDIYDKEEYEKWQSYTMENFKFGFITRTISTLMMICLLLFGVFPFFDDIASDLVNNHIQLTTVFFLGLYWVVTFIVDLYPEYYQTFVIEEKYGFNKKTIKTFIMDKIKGILLTIIFGGGLIYLIASIYKNAGNMFFIYTWISLVIIFLLINILYVPLIVPIFNKLTLLEEGTLKEKINAFAKSVGYEVSKISVINASKRSTKINAYFSGFGKFKNIVLYDTLIEKLSEEEVVSVLAHEIGHNKHKHVIFNLVQTTIMLSVYVGMLLLVLSNDVFSTAFGFDSTNLGFAIILFLTITQPISVLLNIPMAMFSRKHEFQADKYAATKYKKEAMISSFKKLARENYANLTPHPLYVKMNASHPPIVERIRAVNSIRK